MRKLWRKVLRADARSIWRAGIALLLRCGSLADHQGAALFTPGVGTCTIRQNHHADKSSVPQSNTAVLRSQVACVPQGARNTVPQDFITLSGDSASATLGSLLSWRLPGEIRQFPSSISSMPHRTSWNHISPFHKTSHGSGRGQFRK